VPLRNYTVIAEWKDSNGVDDADEIRVRAESAAGAILRAREKWAAEYGDRWPSCRLVDVFVLTPERTRGLA